MSNRDTEYHATLGAILTAITGRLVCPLDELYGLQDFLAGRPLMTHERPAAFQRQADALVRQFPRLAEVEAPDFSEYLAEDREPACRGWVAKVASYIGFTSAPVKLAPDCEVDPGEV